MEDANRRNMLDNINKSKLSLLEEISRNTIELERYLEFNKKLKLSLSEFIQSYYTRDDNCKNILT
jgi:hypothetical protein